MKKFFGRGFVLFLLRFLEAVLSLEAEKFDLLSPVTEGSIWKLSFAKSSLQSPEVECKLQEARF